LCGISSEDSHINNRVHLIWRSAGLRSCYGGVDGQPLAVVEAKWAARDAYGALAQAWRYSEELKTPFLCGDTCVASS